MAFQLIYTSAPRLLAAGRSGFGTVARSRGLSPMVTREIERVSQFANLRGHDRKRVVFVYRRIATGRQRFHVLSRLRDAGSDHTGRTNHIAHHLLLTPEEMAHATSVRVTPADVMRQFPWKDRWEDRPREFEPAEELPIEEVRPLAFQSARAVWQALTGDPLHARLLAGAEAPRTAVLLLPEESDATVVLGEALVELDAESWDRTFTTGLEEGDKLADFDWVVATPTNFPAVIARCGSRAVFDVTRPATLPTPAERPSPESTAAPNPSPTAAGMPEPAASTARPASTLKIHRRVPRGSRSGARNNRGDRKILIGTLAGVGALLLVLSVVVAVGMMRGNQERSADERRALEQQAEAQESHKKQIKHSLGELGVENREAREKTAENLVEQLKRPEEALAYLEKLQDGLASLKGLASKGPEGITTSEGIIDFENLEAPEKGQLKKFNLDGLEPLKTLTEILSKLVELREEHDNNTIDQSWFESLVDLKNLDTRPHLDEETWEQIRIALAWRGIEKLTGSGEDKLGTLKEKLELKKGEEVSVLESLLERKASELNEKEQGKLAKEILDLVGGRKQEGPIRQGMPPKEERAKSPDAFGSNEGPEPAANPDAASEHEAKAENDEPSKELPENEKFVVLHPEEDLGRVDSEILQYLKENGEPLRKFDYSFEEHGENDMFSSFEGGNVYKFNNEDRNPLRISEGKLTLEYKPELVTPSTLKLDLYGESERGSLEIKFGLLRADLGKVHIKQLDKNPLGKGNENVSFTMFSGNLRPLLDDISNMVVDRQLRIEFKTPENRRPAEISGNDVEFHLPRPARKEKEPRISEDDRNDLKEIIGKMEKEKNNMEKYKGPSSEDDEKRIKIHDRVKAEYSRFSDKLEGAIKQKWKGEGESSSWEFVSILPDGGVHSGKSELLLQIFQNLADSEDADPQEAKRYSGQGSLLVKVKDSEKVLATFKYDFEIPYEEPSEQ